MASSFTLTLWHLICLVGYLTNAIAVPESSSGSLEERAAGYQPHLSAIDKKHDPLPARHSSFASVERRDVLEDGSGSDILAPRNALVNPIRESHPEQLQNYGATSRQEPPSRRIKSQRRRPSPRLYHRPDKAVQSLKGHNNPHPAPPCIGFLCNADKDTSSSSSGSVVHSEVSELYKRDATTSGKSQSRQRPSSPRRRKPGNIVPPNDGFDSNVMPSGGRINAEVSELYKKETAANGKGQSQQKAQNLRSSQLTLPSPKYVAPVKNWSTKSRTRPYGIPSGGMSGGSANGGPITHSEALELYKRDVAMSTSSHSQRHTSLHGHRKPDMTAQTQKSFYDLQSMQPSFEYSAPLKNWSPKNRNRPLTSTLIASPDGGSADRGLVTHTEALDSYKKDAGKGLQFQAHKPQDFSQISRQHGGKGFRNNVALQDTDVYRRGSSSTHELFPNDLLAKRAGVPRHSARFIHRTNRPSGTRKGGRPVMWYGGHHFGLPHIGHEYRNNMALGDTEMYRRNVVNTESETAIRPLETQRPDILHRAWSPSPGLRKATDTQQGSLQGSVPSLSRTAELLRRDEEEESTDNTDTDTDTDLLTLILEYLSLQSPSSPTSSSRNESVPNPENGTPGNTEVDDESLDDLATNIQRLADGLDDDASLERRTAPIRNTANPFATAIGAKPNSNKPSQFRPKPKPKPKPKQGRKPLVFGGAAKGGNGGPSAMMQLEGDEPY